MDALIGRYRLKLEETGLVLKHPTGISFDLTVEETIGLRDFVNLHYQTLLNLQEVRERETEPMKAIVLNEEDN